MVIGLMMVPAIMTLVPSFMLYKKMVGTDTYIILILPIITGGSVFGVFLLRSFFEGLSESIFEAARIDGLGEIGIFFKIMMPLSMPAFVSQFILGFIGGYNSYQGPLLYLGSQEHLYPLQLILQQMKSDWGSDAPFQAAMCLFTILPIVIIYLFGQKFFIGGITSGAVKG